MTETLATTALTDTQLRSLLQRAAAFLQNNNVSAADQVIGQVLARHPGNADALQLLGVVCAEQQRYPEAEQAFRQSIAIKPGQPQVHNNLGSLLRQQGRFREAIAEYREAIRHKPNYAEAHLGLGHAFSEFGDFAAAEKSIREALRLQPNFLMAKQSLGAVLNDLGRPKEAEAVFRQALAAGSKNPRQIAALEHNLGVSATMQFRYAEALQLFDSAQAKVPEMRLVEANRGNALQGLGRLDAAVAAYRRAVSQNPLDENSHLDLNHLLYRLGDDEAFLRSYDDAMIAFPTAGVLPLGKANFLFLKEDFDKAQEEFERAAALLPGVAAPHNSLGMIHARRGEFDAAIRAHETALQLAPHDDTAWRNFAETLIRAGDPKKAVEAAERSLAIDPTNQAALAIEGVAFRLLNDSRDEVLNDYENFVQVFEIEPPDGYTDIESFNADLNRYLDNFHRDKREVVDQTLRGGTQTMGNLFGRGHELADRLRARVDEVVAAYIAGMKIGEDHPLLGRRSNAGFRYSGSWSSRLRDCGFHTNHFHPKGWISSAYYIALPDAVADTEGKQGWLKFGEPAFDAGLKEPIKRIVRPQTGQLVLFPSYMYHGTVPFRSEQPRTTVAFDVVPK